jgi:hypothetical protein
MNFEFNSKIDLSFAANIFLLLMVLVIIYFFSWAMIPLIIFFIGSVTGFVFGVAVAGMAFAEELDGLKRKYFRVRKKFFEAEERHREEVAILKTEIEELKGRP